MQEETINLTYSFNPLTTQAGRDEIMRVLAKLPFVKSAWVKEPVGVFVAKSLEIEIYPIVTTNDIFLLGTMVGVQETMLLIF